MLTTGPCAASDELGQLVDLVRYPIDGLSSPASSALVGRCREQLAATDSCFLPGFVPGEALETMRREAVDVSPLAWFGGGRVNAYYDEGDPSLPAEHPRNVYFDRPVGIVAYDQIPDDAALRRFYLRDEVTEFVRACVGAARLYRVNDRYQPVSIMVLNGGEGMGWHFDVSDFTVTLLLQAPEAGGAFEFVHDIRTADDPGYEAIARLYGGDRSRVRTIEPEPGGLLIFQGRHSLHHVAPVVGTRQRLMAVLTYDTTDAATITEEINVATYGPRVATG